MARFVLSMLIASAFTLVANAGDSTDSTIVNHIHSSSNGRVYISQPVELNARLLPLKASDADDNQSEIKGYIGFRVQVFADNNYRTAKNEAIVKERNIMSRFPELSTYISYNAPAWRLRVGDFRTHEEALELLNEIKKEFPSYSRELIIVRDRINIKKND